MGDITNKIGTITDKIKKEEQVRQAAVRMMSSTSNPVVQQQAEQNSREAQRHIDYLQKELEKLQLKQRNSYPPPQGQQSQQIIGQYPQYQNPQVQSQYYQQGSDPSVTYGTPVRKTNYSNLDLIKSDTPITTEKVSLKLHELEFKLDVERKLKEGSQKMADAVLFQDPKNKKSFAEVSGKTLESKEKISLLTRSLQKYKLLYIGEMDDDEEGQLGDENEPIRLKPGLRRPVTGRLHIRVMQIKNVSHAPTRGLRQPETTVVIKVDGTEQARTRTTKNDKWNDANYEIYLQKASEVEITIYDKQQEHHVPIGLLWIKISDIAEELRRKKVEAESGAGWVTAANANFDAQSPVTVNNQNPYQNDPFSIPYGATQPNQGPGSTVVPDGIEAWYEVEPAGQIFLKLNFVKEAPLKKRPEAGLGRQNAFRMRKGEVHEQNGHKFVQQNFYQIMKCAYCEELFVNEGYQCDDCKLTCHKRCYPKIVTKCISKSNAEMDSDYKQLNHRIPHRFENITNITANWCCHCGYMLPLGKRGAKRCSECNITCHAKCSHLVPYFCGLSMKRASDMIDQIQCANQQRDKMAGRASQKEQLNVVTPTDYQPPVQHQPPLPPPQPPQPPQHQQPPVQHQPPPLHVQPYQPPSPQPSQQYALSQQPPQQYQPYPPTTQYSQVESPQEIYPPQYPQDGPSVGRPSSQYQVLPVQQIPPSTQAPGTPNKIQQTQKVGLEDFNFLAVLGKGNFGKVMLAEEKYSKQLWAIKVLKKEFIVENDEVESTRSEKRVFQVANRERHPFLVGLHSCFQTETRIYFVMEYVSGGDLMLHIGREPFTFRRAQYYAAEVLLALEYFHKQGIIYRDLKLDNILLTLDGHIKIADYGLCKEEMWFGSTTNTFCGTPEFMAPEILLEQRYGRAVDWWAFGVLIYEMLLAQSPFRGDDEDEIFDAILEDEILYPINMSRDSVSILQRLLTRDPERRLGSGRGDAEEIKRHPFFKGVNWDDMLAKRVPPPFYPSISSPTDTSNFDEEFTREVPVLTPVHTQLNGEKQKQFEGFSYVSEWVLQQR